MTGAVEIGLSLGSNLGDKAETLRRALALLQDGGVATRLDVSAFYRTAPWGHVTEQDWFLNLCAAGLTTLAPNDLLAACKTIEHQLGRTSTERWGPRVIDIDILYYGDLALDTPGLTLPHREILNRAFVLVPLAEIRPGRHIGDVTVAEAAAAIGSEGVTRVTDPRG